MKKGPPPIPPHLQKPQKVPADPDGALGSFFNKSRKPLPPPPPNAGKKRRSPIPPQSKKKNQSPFAGANAKPKPENSMELPALQEPEPNDAKQPTPNLPDMSANSPSINSGKGLLQPQKPTAKLLPKRPTPVFAAEPYSSFADEIPNSLNSGAKEPSPLPVETPAKNTRSSMPLAIDITHTLEGSASAIISIDRELVHLNGSSLFQKIADVCIILQPLLEQEEIRFEMGGIFAGNKKIGDFAGDSSRIKIEISLDSLGYPINSLPLGAIKSEFDISGLSPQIASAISESSSVAILAMRFGKRELIKLGFFNKDGLLEQTAPLKEQ